MPIYALGDQRPEVDPAAYLHPDAIVIGSVRIAAEANIWPAAVLRGDYGEIVVGERSSVQDGTVVHAGADCATVIGRNCVVGHNAYLEGCVIEDECLIGSMASMLPFARIGRGAVVAAGAVVTRGLEVPASAMAVGVPARVIEQGAADHDYAAGVQHYVDNARRYAAELRRL